MHRKTARKLHLSKETVRSLASDDLRRAAGGATAAFSCGCTKVSALFGCTVMSGMSDCIDCETDPTKTKGPGH